MFLLFYIVYHNDIVDHIRSIQYAYLGYLIIIVTFIQFFNGLLLRDLATKFGIGLSPKEWIGLPYITSLGNYITPFSGGMIARAAYLKLRHTLSYANFASVFAASSILLFWIAGVIGTVATIAFEYSSKYFYELIAFFISPVLVLSCIALFPIIQIPGEHVLIKTFNNVITGWKLIRTDYRLLGRLSLYTFIIVLLNGISFWFAFVALSYNSLSPGKILLISLFSAFSIIIRVTPGSLGVTEAVVGFSSGILGCGVNLGLAVSLLIRAASLIPVCILGPIFSLLLSYGVSIRRRDI